MKKIRIGIVGYGNLGKGVELSISQNPDMELAAVISRRNDFTIKTPNVPVFSIDEAEKLIGTVDVMILCGGSATDLPQQTPHFTKWFNTVDSFDNHSQVQNHFDTVDKVAKESGKVSVISVGWDPGMFSLSRLYSECVLPQGSTYTFWGKGVSQGHSDAIRRISGVLDARQYTIPSDTAVEAVRSGENPELTTRQKHTRECFVVAKPDANITAIENEIKTMPAYFSDYDTTVHFISMEELMVNHSGLPHGGMVIRSGTTGEGNNHIIEYKLTLGSNPEFTSNILVAYARAAHSLSNRGQAGCYTALDIAPAMLSPKTAQQLRELI